MSELNEYEQQAQTFLNSSGTEMKIRKTGVVEGFPFSPEDRMPHDRYSVTLIRGDKKYTFPFYDSYMNHVKSKCPKPYDILACLCSYEVPENMWEFGREFGYEVKDEESYNCLRRTWQECRKQYKKLMELFGPYFMERLAEIT